MKAVCILGSPRANGNTAAIVSEIIRALAANGIPTSLYRLSEMDIGYCFGCMSCDTTGTCIQADDVRKIVEAMHEAQLVIIASPSYWGDVTGQMKVFMDRCTPYCNTNPARMPVASSAKGVAVAIRAGENKGENMNLVHTIEHFLSHLNIPLVSHFTVEGVKSATDLAQRPQVLSDAYAFGEGLCGT